MGMLRRNRWIMAAMAMLLLLATSGISVSRMTCVMSGRSTVSLGQAKDCSPGNEAKSKAFEATCCDFGQAGGDRINLVQAAPLASLALPVADAAPVAPPQPSAGHAVVRWPDSRPPPLQVLERLAHVRCFLI